MSSGNLRSALPLRESSSDPAPAGASSWGRSRLLLGSSHHLLVCGWVGAEMGEGRFPGADVQDPGGHPVSAAATGGRLPLCPGIGVRGGGLGSPHEDWVTLCYDDLLRGPGAPRSLGLTSPCDGRVGRLQPKVCGVGSLVPCEAPGSRGARRGAESESQRFQGRRHLPAAPEAVLRSQGQG